MKVFQAVVESLHFHFMMRFTGISTLLWTRIKGTVEAVGFWDGGHGIPQQHVGPTQERDLRGLDLPTKPLNFKPIKPTSAKSKTCQQTYLLFVVTVIVARLPQYKNLKSHRFILTKKRETNSHLICFQPVGI